MGFVTGMGFSIIFDLSTLLVGDLGGQGAGRSGHWRRGSLVSTSCPVSLDCLAVWALLDAQVLAIFLFSQLFHFFSLIVVLGPRSVTESGDHVVFEPFFDVVVDDLDWLLDLHFQGLWRGHGFNPGNVSRRSGRFGVILDPSRQVQAARR